MNWNDLLPQSVSSFMSASRKARTEPSVANHRLQLEDVRVAMLHALAQIEPAGYFQLRKTRDAILGAMEVQTLWYLRCDLLCLLSDFRGEPFARQQLNTITEMFRGMVSHSQLPQLQPKRQPVETTVDTQSIEP